MKQGKTSSYKDDSYDGVSAVIRSYVDEHYLKSLKNIQIANPKLLVVFSGGNAVGKSTLAKKIGDECSALVLENDAIKHTIMEQNPRLSRDERNLLTWQYTMDLYHRIDHQFTKNGLIVRDGVIDWYYDRILPIFQQKGYVLFVVGYDISLEKNEALIRARGDQPAVTVERLIEMMPEHRLHIQRFRENYTPDIVLNDDTIFDTDRVIDTIKEKIQYMTR